MLGVVWPLYIKHGLLLSARTSEDKVNRAAGGEEEREREEAERVRVCS